MSAIRVRVEIDVDGLSTHMTVFPAVQVEEIAQQGFIGTYTERRFAEADVREAALSAMSAALDAMYGAKS